MIFLISTVGFRPGVRARMFFARGGFTRRSFSSRGVAKIGSNAYSIAFLAFFDRPKAVVFPRREAYSYLKHVFLATFSANNAKN